MSGSKRRSPPGSGRAGTGGKGRTLATPATAFAAAEKTRAELECELAAARGRIEELEDAVVRGNKEREEVCAAERRLAEVAENLPGIIFRRRLHPDGQISYEHVAGKSHARSDGIEMPVGKEISQQVFGRIHTDDRDALKSAIATSAASMAPLDLTYRKWTSDGELRWERATGRPRKAKGGDIIWDSIAVDITARKQAENELLETKQRFQAILDNIPCMVWINDEDDRYELVNREFLTGFGLTADEVIGRTNHDIFPREIADRYKINSRAVRVTGVGHAVEEPVHQFGEARTRLSVQFPLDHGDGRPASICGISTDITERKQAEEALRNSEARLRAIVDHAPVSIALKDRDGRYILYSAHSEEIMGVGAKDVLAKTSHDWAPKAVADGLAALDRAVFESGETTEWEYELPMADGPRTFLTTKFPVPDGAGNIVSVGGITADITERRRAEEALREREEWLRLVTDNVPALITYLDKEERFRFNNRFCEKWYGFSPAAMYGKSAREVFGAARYAEVRPHLVAALSGQLVHYTGVIRNKQDDPRTVDVTLVPHVADDGEVHGYIALALDVTERDATLRALRESEERLRAVIDHSPASVVLKDLDGRHVVVSSQSARVFGLTAEDVLHKTAHELLPKPLADRLVAHDRAAFESGRAVEREYELPRPDGTHTLLTIKFPVPGADGAVSGIGSSSIDITERKRAERALRESEERLRAIIDNSPASIALKDPDGRFILIGKRTEENYGVSYEEVLNRTSHELASKEEADKLAADDRAVLKTGKVVARETEIAIAGRPRVLLVVKFPVPDASGSVAAIGVVSTDITERKEAERGLAAAREELAKREKLAVLGQLTATVSHEIRNPLGTMRSSIHVIRQKLADDDPLLLRALDRIDRNVTRCDRIIDELLDFTRTRGFESQPVEIDPWLSALLDDQPVLVGLAIEYDLRAAGLIASIEGDRLRRAVINVYENACQAMADGYEPGSTAPGSRLRVSTAVCDERLEIVLADTGPGIAADVLPKIFEPLFSTKSFGVGLGLPVVRQVLEMHGGGVEVETDPGEGTRFRLWLPVSAPEGEARP